MAGSEVKGQRAALCRLKKRRYTATMWDDDLLTLEQAALLTGRPKRALRELARGGRLPGVRREGHWLFTRADLRSIGQGRAVEGSLGGQAAPIPPAREEMMALLELIRQRDAQISALQDERMRLAGQVGFLLGQLLEREERMRRLLATSIYQREIPVAAQEVEFAAPPVEHAAAASTGSDALKETGSDEQIDRTGPASEVDAPGLDPLVDRSTTEPTPASSVAVSTLEMEAMHAVHADIVGMGIVQPAPELPADASIETTSHAGVERIEGPSEVPVLAAPDMASLAASSQVAASGQGRRSPSVGAFWRWLGLRR